MTVLLYIAVLCFSALLYRACKGRPALSMLLCGGDGDEDIKIAGASYSPPVSVEDSAEAVAKEFLRHKSVGNIDKARELGILYAGGLLDLEKKSHGDCDVQHTQQEVHHQLLLCSYAVNRVIAEGSPNSILAQTSLNVFYNEVERLSPGLHRHISDMAAFSLYILCERSQQRDQDEIGRVFARLCGRENDLQAVEEGNRIYRECYSACMKHMENTHYESIG